MKRFSRVYSLCKFISFWLAGLAVLTGLFAGCSPKKSDQQKDTMLEAYRLIDEQRTPEAIELLENALADDPENPQYKTVLASAYAHRAGVRIQTLVPILSKADKLKTIEEKAERAKKIPSIDESVNSSVLDFAGLLSRFSSVLDAYGAIPVVNNAEAVYLMHAIYILNSIGPKIKQEDALYRAVLEVILFKHVIAEGLIGEFSPPPGDQNMHTCKLNLGAVNDTVIQLGKLLIDIYTDVGHANPQMAGDVKEMSANVGNAVSNFTIATTAVTVLDEAASLFLKQSVIQNGFGKIIKCGGS